MAYEIVYILIDTITWKSVPGTELTKELIHTFMKVHWWLSCCSFIFNLAMKKKEKAHSYVDRNQVDISSNILYTTQWIENLKQSLEEIGWMGVGMEELGRLSNGEVVQMLRDCVWRAVKESWAVQAEQHSKLKVVKELIEIRCEAKCMDVESKGI